MEVYGKYGGVRIIEGTRKTLIIDNREPQSFIDYANAFFKDKDITVKVEEMGVGDFLYDHIIIERKEINDFVSSIHDSRLHNQKRKLVKMANMGYHSYLIIMGEYKDIDKQHHNLSKTAFAGAIASLNEYGVHTIHVGQYDLLLFYEMIYGLIRKFNEEKKITKIFVEPDSTTWTERSLMCISGIGKETATKIAKKLPHIRRFYECDKKTLSSTLQEVDGIGKKTSEKIVEEIYGESKN